MESTLLLMQTISPKNSGNFAALLNNNKSQSSTFHPKESDMTHAINYTRLSNNLADLNQVQASNKNGGSPFKTVQYDDQRNLIQELERENKHLKKLNQ